MSGNHYFAYRSFLPEFDTMRQFAESGGDTICFFPANTTNSLGEPYCQYRPNWLWFDTYDFSVVDEQVEDITQVVPNARLLCIIDLNSPQWLARQLSLAHDSADSFTHLTEALANPRWCEETDKYLQHFIQHCERHHAHRIHAYVLACGHTDEWLDHNGELCGLHKTRLFHAWQRQQGLHPTEVPGATALNQPDYDELLFDPQRNRDVVNYRRFCNELVGSAICRFAKCARQLVRNTVEIGVFYGYLIDRLGVAESGHAAYEMVLHSRDIDFLISPGTYRDREIGGGSGFLTVSGSERLAGKVHLHECDQRTHTHNRKLSAHVSLNVPCWNNSAEDLAGLKRELALSVINRNSLWWFDMWGGFYQGQEIFKLFSQMKRIYDQCLAVKVENTAQIALIVDPDGTYYMDQRSPRQGDFQLNARRMLNRCGAPYEVFSFNDLEKIAGGYRFYVFANQIEITPQKADVLHKHVLNSGHTVLWLYAPGISDGVALNPSNIKKWTGVGADPHGRILVEHEGWRSAYLADPADLTADHLASLAEGAGVHLFCHSRIPIYANSHLLAIHSAGQGETVCIHLPPEWKNIRELFTGEATAIANGSFVCSFDVPDTRLYLRVD